MAQPNGHGSRSVASKWNAGNLQFLDASGNVIFTIDAANRKLSVPSGSAVEVLSGATFTQSGTRTSVGGLVATVPLAAVDTAGGVFAWQAPVACFVRELLIDVTTPATGACTVDVGPAADGTTLNDTALDGIDVHTAAAVFSSRDATNGGDTAAYTDAVLTFKKCAAGQWFTGSKASGASAGLVGNAYIVYMPV